MQQIKKKKQEQLRMKNSSQHVACSQPESTSLLLETTPHSAQELTTDGTKQSSENIPVAQRDILHMIEKAAQSGSPKEMLECFNQLIHTENKVNQESLDQGLLLSCRYGREFLVKILIFHGANMETRDKDGNTPLLICAEKGFTDIALLLVDKGADINSYNKDGDTALLLSIQTSGSSQLLKKLLGQQDLDVNHRNKNECNALMKAMEVLNLPILKMLIKHHSFTQKFNDLKNKTISESDIFQLAESLGLKSLLNVLIQHKENSVLKAAVVIKDIYVIQLLLYCGMANFSDDFQRRDHDIISKFLSFLENNKREISHEDLIIFKLLLKAGAPLRSDYEYYKNPMTRAVRLGCYDLVELFCLHVENEKNSNHNYFEDASLTSAAEMGRCDIVNLLIKHGKRELNMRSALNYSINHLQIDCAKLLIKHGATIDAKEALQDIVKNNRVQSFLFLREHFKSKVNLKFKSIGAHLMNIAASEGHKEMIKLLVQEGASLNEIYDYKTPLMSTLDLSVMKLLIENGADVNAKVERYSDKFTIFDYILNERNVRKRRVKLVKMVNFLINHGFNVNVQDKKGNTPLMKASQKSNMEKVLRSLLQSGAVVNKQNKNGESALHLAVYCKSIPNAKVLLEFSSDIDLKTTNGETPLFYSLSRQYSQMIQFIIENNANVNCEDKKGDTPLLSLCLRGDTKDVDVIKMLIKYGACVNHHNSEGYTPLMAAAKNQSIEVLQVLCESGAEINSVNEKKKETALSILLDMPYDKNIVLYLIEKGADCSCVSPAIIHQLIVKKEFSSLKHIIALGLGPAEITPESFDPGAYGYVSKTEPASTFVLSLSKGFVKTARFLNDIWFLSLSDVSNTAHLKQLSSLLEERYLIECLEFLDEYSSQPMSLEKLSFVAVSSAVGADAGRNERVQRLPIPNKFKDKLLFTNAKNKEDELEEDFTVDRISTSNRLVSYGFLNTGLHRRRHLYSEYFEYYPSYDFYDNYNPDYDSDY